MKKILSITKALSDGNRLRVLLALMHKGEMCGCHVSDLLQVTAPTVSRHMNILQSAGLVESRKTGRWVFYRLADDLRDSDTNSVINWLFAALKDDPSILADQTRIQHIPACTPDASCVGKKGKRIIKQSKPWTSNSKPRQEFPRRPLNKPDKKRRRPLSSSSS